MAKIPAGDNDLGRLRNRVRHHLGRLLERARDVIAAQDDGEWHLRTTLFVGATGGMRSLVDVGRKARIEHQVRQCIHEYTNAENLDAIFYATISGASEGLFGWAALNYTQSDNADAGGPFTSRVGYLEMGGQSMQIAFHSPENDEDNPRHFRRITIGGEVHNVYAREWKAHGIDATWESHITRRENLYPAASPNPSENNRVEDNCIPKDMIKDGVTGAGNFYACIEEALWHVRCVYGCATLDGVAGSCPSVPPPGIAAHPGCLMHSMPPHVRQNIHTNVTISRWVGGAKFFYGAFGVFNNARREELINGPGYQPLELLGEAARLHVNVDAGGNEPHPTRMPVGNLTYATYSATREYLWQAVFTAAYTTLIVRKGFGIQIPDTQEMPDPLSINRVVNAANTVPRPTDPAANVLPAILNALSSAGDPQANRKRYSTVGPKAAPWALGAAVLLACATAVELPGGGASSVFQKLIGLDAHYSAFDA